MLSAVVIVLTLVRVAFATTPMSGRYTYEEGLASTSIERDDIIGFYTLHPQSHHVAPNKSCPLSMTTRSFDYAIVPAPSAVTAPVNFSMIVPHSVTELNGVGCDDTGAHLLAVTHDHPYVTNRMDSIHAWTGAGNGNAPALPWLQKDYETFVNFVAPNPWIIGYDFTERTCGTSHLPSHAAFLWFQPHRTFTLSGVPITPDNKYLLVAFGNTLKHQACLLVAQQVGGQGEFPTGPVNGPSVESTYTTRPRPSYEASVGIPEGVPPPKGLHSPSPSASSSNTPTPTASPSEVPPSSPPPSPSPSPDPTPDVIENDVDGPLGAAASSPPPSCFAGSARVSLADGRTAAMTELRIGDRVAVEPKTDAKHITQHSPIILFSHRLTPSSTLFPFLNITLDNSASLLISDNHYVYVDHSALMLPARLVRQRTHRVRIADGSLRRVMKVRRTFARGLYAPQTAHGDIVVDGVVVSTYTTDVHPTFAHHVLLAPVRLAHRLGLSWIIRRIQPLFDNGAPTLARFLPSGPHSMRMR